jgi:5'-deoxynucleotidase
MCSGLCGITLMDRLQKMVHFYIIIESINFRFILQYYSFNSKEGICKKLKKLIIEIKEVEMNHFFAYLSRMKLIQRWGLMRNTRPENIQEHSLQVAQIAHGLALISNVYYGGKYDPERIMALAVFHEVGEVITGDIATPIKYWNPEVNKAFKHMEEIAKIRLSDMLPYQLKEEYNSYFFYQESDKENWKIVKAADKICAYLKCIEELKTGNGEFLKAEKSIKAELDRIEHPAVKYFITNFVPSFSLTLDELN